MRMLFAVLLYCLNFDSWAIMSDSIQAQFLVKINRNEVYVCECYTVSASFLIGPNNKIPLQFYDMFKQIDDFTRSLAPTTAWINRNIDDSKHAKDRIVEGQYYKEYKILKLSICPTEIGQIIIPKLKLLVARVNPKDRSLQDSVFFYSEPHGVNVLPLPDYAKDSVYTNDQYYMVGSFELEENSMTYKNRNFQLGDTISYELTIRGKGMTYPISLNVKNTSNAEIIRSQYDQDTSIVRNILKAHKTFKFKIVPLTADTIWLRDYLQWRYFSPDDKQIHTLAPKAYFSIRGKKRIMPPKFIDSLELVVLVDISESMKIEDYMPNRQAVVVKLANEIVKQHQNSVIVIFDGTAKVLSTQHIEALKRQPQQMGTAIGNAVWTAKELFKESRAIDKKIVLICDGDNTAGNLSETMAATIAQEYNIIIHSVGIGYSGKLQYGYDFLGHPKYIDNIFRSASLKKVAQITGGKYMWLSREDNLKKVAQSLFE